MKYWSVAEACKMPGLRLVLTSGVPGPWGESAKALLNARNVDFIPVAQEARAANEALCAWTGGIRNAPIVMLDDAPPVHGWLDIAMLAERMGHGPSLLPASSADRALAFGISSEICAPEGFGWCRRLEMMDRDLHASHGAMIDPGLQRMMSQYDFTAGAASTALARLTDILRMLTARLLHQHAAGSPYLVGDRASIADYHWACFSQMIAPLSLIDQPAMPAALAARYSMIDTEIAAALNPILIDHRNTIYERHIGLPLDY